MAEPNKPEVAIVGGGIGGLALALSLHRVGIACQVYEAVPALQEVGVGITLLPHAMRELQTLGLAGQAEAAGIENLESVFFNRFGQYIYREPRGRHAGYPLPEVGIPRGRLHRILLDAFLERVGADRLHLGRRFQALTQDEQGVTLGFADGSSATASLAVASDGVNSAVRAQFYPGEPLAFGGINTWRGVTVRPPILTGRSYMRIGSINTGKMVIYPIADNVDGQGNQLINWVAEIRREGAAMNDWNRPGNPEDFVELFASWRYDWLDVPALIRGAQRVFEYPMVDRDPVPRWTFGRVTLLGDAAHPMYPRGSNGSAQALIDARVLAEGLAAAAQPAQALQAYEQARLPTTARIVQTNRSVPPDFINIRVEELTGDRPFGHIDEVISQDELRKLSDDYKKVAGFSLEAVRR
ncbi:MULTISPECIES: flavin-dependent oxidoreductase [Ramlibacter]|uniref:Flavin-dependent oxidoreductase n=1 Tax=Ramlibacter aquaticus TaxID=2780094 RepID=A0ABR9SC95_9BURK|nr:MULTISPECIES: flavin-dependent oxidoreductase [Ramlibacter]MBE7939968.1 flavin-dependent oxidoreductase [Ramlibacter aquaticus]